jgi:hypothetical protein
MRLGQRGSLDVVIIVIALALVLSFAIAVMMTDPSTAWR